MEYMEYGSLDKTYSGGVPEPVLAHIAIAVTISFLFFIFFLFLFLCGYFSIILIFLKKIDD